MSSVITLLHPFFVVNKYVSATFHRGDTDTFKFTTRNVGQVDSILLGHRERSDGPKPKGSGREVDWHCHEVVVMDTSSGSKWVHVVHSGGHCGEDVSDLREDWEEVNPLIFRPLGRV